MPPSPAAPMAFDGHRNAGDDSSCAKTHPYRDTYSTFSTDDALSPDASGDLEKLDSRHGEDDTHFQKEQYQEEEDDDDDRQDGRVADGLAASTTYSTSDHESQRPSRLPERVASRMSASSALTFPEGGRDGWLAVVGSFCAMLSIFGLINSSAVFESYFAEHQLKDYSSSQIGWIFSLYLFCVFFVGIYIGPIFDRRGPSWLVPTGSLFMVLSLMLLGFCTSESACCHGHLSLF